MASSECSDLSPWKQISSSPKQQDNLERVSLNSQLKGSSPQQQEPFPANSQQIEDPPKNLQSWPSLFHNGGGNFSVGGGYLMSTNAPSQLSGKSNMAQVEHHPSYQQQELTDREESDAPSLNHEKAQLNRSLCKIQERVGCHRNKSDPYIREATTWSPVENTTYRYFSMLEDKRPLSSREDHAKADSPGDTHLPPAPQSQPRFSWSQIADVKVAERQRTPINSKMLGEHIKSHEMSPEEKKRGKKLFSSCNFLFNLTKVRHLFLSHRGSDNSPLLIVFSANYIDQSMVTFLWLKVG